MFKKLLPLFVVLALLVAYAGYRVASAQAIGAGNSQNDRFLRNVEPGALSPGFEYWQMQVARMNAVNDHSLRNVDPGAPPIGFEYWQMHAGSASEITDYTNLSTGDVAHEQSYVDPDDCNLPRVRSPGAQGAPVPSC